MSKKPIGAIDAEIGRRIKQRRDQMGLSQIAVGKAAGVSQQQIGKYESGADHANFERLASIARALDVQPGYLLGSIAPMISAAGFSDAEQERYGRPLATQRVRLNQAFDAIRDERKRELVVQLAEALRSEQD